MADSNLSISELLKQTANIAITPQKALRSTHQIEGNIFDTLKVLKFEDLRKIEIDLAKVIRDFKKEYRGSTDAITRLKECVKRGLKERYGEKIKAWRNRGWNLIMYVGREYENAILMDRAILMENTVYSRFKPVITKGEIDPRYYRVKINLDYRITTELAIINLEKRWKIWEIEIGADYGIDNGTITAYIWLDSMEQIFDLGNTVDILGMRCHISHQWNYTCNVCKKRGHFEEDCQEIKEQIKLKENIEKEAEKIEKQRWVSTQIYYCKTLVKPDLIILDIRYNGEGLEVAYKRGIIEAEEMGRIERKKDKGKWELFIRFLNKLNVYKFAVYQIKEEDFKNLPMRELIYTNTLSNYCTKNKPRVDNIQHSEMQIGQSGKRKAKEEDDYNEGIRKLLKNYENLNASKYGKEKVKTKLEKEEAEKIDTEIKKLMKLMVRNRKRRLWRDNT